MTQITTEERLAKIEKNVALYALELRLHTDQDTNNFSLMATRLDDISSKLDDLRLSVAKRNGSLDEARRHSRNQGAIWGGSVAALLSALGVALSAWLGRGV